MVVGLLEEWGHPGKFPKKIDMFTIIVGFIIIIIILIILIIIIIVKLLIGRCIFLWHLSPTSPLTKSR